MGVRSELLKKYNLTGGAEDGGTAKSTGGSVRRKLLDKYYGDVNEGYINSFLTDTRSFFDSAEEEYGGMSYGNAAATYDTKNSTYKDLKTRADTIRGWLHSNQYSLDEETYSSLTKALDDYDTSAGEMLGQFQTARDYYAQWETEEDYNQYISNEGMKTFDTKAGASELEQMEADFNEYYSLDRMIANAKQGWYATEEQRKLGVKGLIDRKAAYEQKYGSPEALQAQIDEKRTYLNDATELQQQIAENEGLRSFDTAAGTEQIEQMSKDYEDWFYSRANVSAGRDYFTAEEIAQKEAQIDAYEEQYGSLEKLQDQITQKTAYNNRAKHLQDYYAMIGVGDENSENYDPDFAESVTMGKALGQALPEDAPYLSVSELELYYYYLGQDRKNGTREADHFMSVMQETINYRKAEERFEDMEGKWFQEMLFGIEAGLDQFGSGIMTLINTQDSYIPASSTQMLSGMVREDLGHEWGGTSLGQVAYDVVTTGANMAPSVLASAVVTAATGNPVAGQATGSILLGASAAGNAYQEVLNLGYSKADARAYSTLVGASEAGLEYLLGGISALGGSVTSELTTSLLNKVDNALWRTFGKIGGSMLSEFSEEYLQEVLTPVFKNLTLGTEEDIRLVSADALYAGMLGALTGGLFEGPGIIGNSVKTYTTGTKLQAADISVQRLAELGKTFSADTVAYQLAGRVDENTGAYTIGRLFNEIGAELTELNKADISAYLENAGVSGKDAKTITEAFAAVVAGGQFTDKQTAMIEANDTLAKAVVDVIIDPNSTVNQRSLGYRQVLKDLAKAKTTANASTEGPVQASPENVTNGGNVAVAEKKAAEDGYEVSAEGQTIRKDTGETVRIKEVASLNGGKMTLRLEDGSEVNASDVAYASEEQAIVYEAVANMDVNASTANVLVNAYHTGSGVSADVYANGIQEAYTYGKYNIPVKEMMANGSFSPMLTEYQRQTAYKLGKLFGGKEVAKAQATVSKKESVPVGKDYRKGTVQTTGVAVNTFNSTQKAAYKLLKTYAEVTGIDIVLYQSKVGADGQFEGDSGLFRWSEDKIYIDVNAGLMNTADTKQTAKYTMLRTFAHEFTHFIEKWNPVRYNEFRTVVFDELKKRGENVDALIRQKQAQDTDGKMTPEEASREVVAEAMTDILPDANFVQTLAQKHKTVFRKLLEQLKAFTQKVKEYFGTIGGNLSREANALKDQVGEGVRYAESIVELFDKIAVEAVENYQAAEKTQKNSALEDRVQMQTRTVNGNEVVWIEDNILKENKGVPVHQFIADYIAEHIGEVYTIIESGQKVYIGDDLPGEYTQSKYTKAILRHNPNISRAKNRAVTNLGEMIEIATNRRWEKTKHVHSKDAKYGMYRYDTRLGFPVKDTNGTVVGANIFAAELLIRNASDGKKYLYDIVSIKKDTASSDWLTNKSASAAGKPAGQKKDVSRISISNDKQNVNKNSGEQHQRRTPTLTNQDIISQMEGKTPLEQEKLREYQKTLEEANAQAQKLEELNEQIGKLDANEPKDKEKIRDLKQEAIKAKNRRDIKQSQLRRMENGVLEPLIAREKGQILERLQAEYGTIPSGEKAVRPDALPRSTDGENRVSYTARTAKGAGVTPDDFAELIDQDVVKGGLSYIRISNNEATQRAAEAIRKKGWEAAKYEWMAQVKAGKTGAEMVATGALLLNNAARAGDKESWLDILHDYQMMGTNSAQAVQAMRILKTLTPDDSLYMAERSVEQMVADMRLGVEIQIDAALKQAYLKSETVEARDEAMAEIQQNVADQIPSTLLDKWTALRYLNMLGNLRTQVRNLAGNGIMGATVELKNLIATGMENLAYWASGGKFQKSKSFVVSKDMMKAARADFREVEAVISDGGKYNDPKVASTTFSRGVMEKREIFKRKLLKWAEKYRTATNWAMDKGDVLFSKYAYARALAGYLKVHGVSDSDFSKVDMALLDEARLYAIQEAQEATFHDMNVVSKALSKRYRGKNTFAKFGNVALEGIMPFRKTPANIAVRAEEYSPLGVLNSVYYTVQALRKNTDVTGAQVINSWAKTFSGSGIFLLGWLLASTGCLIGGPDDDDGLDEFQELNGQQNYALKFGDWYATIDWASPTAIPMFMGAQMYKLAQEDGIQAKDIEAVFTSLVDPMIQMSMLQGVNDTLGNIKYSKNNVMQLVINAMVSYTIQGTISTFLGQLERSFEKSRMQTYVDKNSVLPDWLQRTLGKASAKIPGLEFNQIPYINAWGEEEENPGLLANLAYNMLSPSYISGEKTDAVSQELTRLNEVNESGRGVFPSTPEKTATFTDSSGVKHKDYYLSAEEYEALAKEQGQTQRQIIESMVESKLYNELPDQYKVKAVQAAYDYAREYAQIQVLDRDGFSSDWMTEIKGDIAEGIVEHVRKENIKGMYLAGDITATEAANRYAKYFGKSKEAAAEKIAYWNFQDTYAEYAEWTQSAVTKYYDYAKGANISLKVYNDYLAKTEGLDKKDDIEAVIDSLPLSKAQKDELYLSHENWSRDKLSEARWNRR